MKSRQIILVLLAAVAATLSWPIRSDAENAVRFTDTTVQAGDRFTVDIDIENEIELGGVFIPFHWSSDDLHYDSLVFVADRFRGKVVAGKSQVDHVRRISGILLSTGLDPGDPWWLPVGAGPVARVYFTVSSEAPDQYAYVDSVNRPPGLGWSVQFTTLWQDPLEAVTHPGTITIGNPAAVTMSVSPGALSFRGEVGGTDPRGQRLMISSSSGAAFDWLANWSSSWLTVSPSAGKAPAQPEVTVDLFALEVGRYEDTIVLESRHARNSPIRIPVVLQVDTAGFRPPSDLGFELFQNHPNPFVTYHDPETEIRYYLKDADHVQIRIYDVMGRPLRTLFSGRLAAGDRSLRWDGRDDEGIIVASGRYFCRMTTSKGTITRPMVVIK